VAEDITSRGDFTTNTGFVNEGSFVSSSSFVVYSSEEKPVDRAAEEERYGRLHATELRLNVRH